MTNIERIQQEGIKLLSSSNWEEKKIKALEECLLDFTSQAWKDEMYRDAKVELWQDDEEQTIDIIWKTDYLNTRVILCDDISAHWDLFAGIIIDGVEVVSESEGGGGDEKVWKTGGMELEPSENWAFHFYLWLDDYFEPSEELIKKRAQLIANK